ncbi:FAD dependent oxidoreductase [Lipomyces japonicus]|uniref:FAD dependent oxidoreductase n=1 Tax=Lipomyces japonicus TaxID=56871 RepID=UPI0034CF747B
MRAHSNNDNDIIINKNWHCGLVMPTKFSKEHSTFTIVGAGEFGLSLAYHMLQSGYKHVTVIDRTEPPVPDGSSVDISRIVRADYSDPTYAKMVVQALTYWKTDFKECYHPVGLLCLTPNHEPKYVDDAFNVVTNLGLPVTSFENQEQAQKFFNLPADRLHDLAGYVSHDAGWAHAERAVAKLYRAAVALGLKFVRATVTGFEYAADRKSVTGLRLHDGNVISSDVYVNAAGAWVDSLVDTGERMMATGQAVGFVQLTDAEYERYKDLPVYINFVTGFYCFPAHPESKIVKAARHGYGYTNYLSLSSSTHHGAAGTEHDHDRLSSQPPAVAYDKGPEIASREYCRTRICWYNDTATKDFLFDYKPDVDNLFFATGGSGHGFKFLPIIGKYALGCLERTLSTELLDKFSWRTNVEWHEDLSRGGSPMMPLPNVQGSANGI